MSPSDANQADRAGAHPGSEGQNQPPAAPPEGQGAGDPAATSPETPATAEQQLAEMRDRWLRACAELENLRRRARLDLDDCRRHGNASLLVGLLPVLDSLQRALTARPQDADPQLWAGIELAERMFVSALAAQGVTPLEAAVGTPFDPSCQQAVLEVPTDAYAPGMVMHEVVRGYRLHDRLLRESQVTVSSRLPSDSAAPDVEANSGRGDHADADV